MGKKLNVHPYIPNTVPEVQQEMLDFIGVNNIDELFDGIPDELRLKEQMNIPGPLSEFELRRLMEELLNRNRSTKEYVSFLGGGTWEHYVPAICDAINNREEFLTAYTGKPYQDHGRYQALFEYQSLMAELIDMEVVNVPTFDWGQSIATSMRMAARITDKSNILVPATMSPERLKIVENYCSPDLTIKKVKYCTKTGKLDLEDLQSKIDSNTAAVYVEYTSYLGFIELSTKEVIELTKQKDIISIVGVDPSSLGVLEPPGSLGADIVCGELQPLGIHMSYGGGQSGFIATRNEEKFIMEYPSRLISIVPTVKEGEYGFGEALINRMSLQKREKGKEFVGTQTSLWAITAGVYLALMGPTGMYELGKTIMQKTQYTIQQLQDINGVTASRFGNMNFKEFVVDFNETGKTVAEINELLLNEGIFGGIDLSKDFEELGQCALYCVTEIHNKKDIDKLVAMLTKIIEA